MPKKPHSKGAQHVVARLERQNAQLRNTISKLKKNAPAQGNGEKELKDLRRENAKYQSEIYNYKKIISSIKREVKDGRDRLHMCMSSKGTVVDALHAKLQCVRKDEQAKWQREKVELKAKLGAMRNKHKREVEKNEKLRLRVVDMCARATSFVDDIALDMKKYRTEFLEYADDSFLDEIASKVCTICETEQINGSIKGCGHQLCSCCFLRLHPKTCPFCRKENVEFSLFCDD